jgi:hypothetical protein
MKLMGLPAATPGIAATSDLDSKVPSNSVEDCLLVPELNGACDLVSGSRAEEAGVLDLDRVGVGWKTKNIIETSAFLVEDRVLVRIAY